MNEQWTPIIGYESFYEVSNEGRVKGLAGRPKCTIKGDVIKTPVIDHEGYRRVWLSRGSKKKPFKVARLVALHFVRNARPNDAKEVNHIDGDKSNDRSDNLEWNTRAENTNHAMRNGLLASGARSGRYTKPEKTARGSNHGNSKLNEDKVKKIKELITLGLSNQEIANRFHVSNATIWFIRRGDSWRHVVAQDPV